RPTTEPPEGTAPRSSTKKSARRPPPCDRESPRAPNRQAARIDPAGHSHYACRHHEDASSWACGLAMIALASVIASPLCGSIRGVPGVRPRLFLSQEVTKKPRFPYPATRRGRLHLQSAAFKAPAGGCCLSPKKSW